MTMIIIDKIIVITIMISMGVIILIMIKAWNAPGKVVAIEPIFVSNAV